MVPEEERRSHKRRLPGASVNKLASSMEDPPPHGLAGLSLRGKDPPTLFRSAAEEGTDLSVHDGIGWKVGCFQSA